MTLDYFLDTYVPTVLKPMGGWGFIEDRYIRRERFSCPLTAAKYQHPVAWYCGPLGDSVSAALIVAAADKRPKFQGAKYRQAIRARLLAGLGLSEPGGERGSR